MMEVMQLMFSSQTKTVFPFLFLLFSCTSIKNRKHDHEHDAQGNHIINYWSNYELNDAQYGTVTKVTVDEKNRVMKTNALPNHPTGNFPNSGNPNKILAQNKTYTFPLHPLYTGKPIGVKETGVALNGVKFEPETAELFVCNTGERYRVEAFQNLIDLGLDSNHAHVQPSGAYHYHGVPTGIINSSTSTTDIVLVGFAMDGFPIYYSKSAKYKSSFKLSDKSRTGDVCDYKTPKVSITKELKGTQPDGTFISDWQYVKGHGELDECNGITIDGNYMYFVTNEYPYVGRCLMGQFNPQTNGNRSGRPQGAGQGPHQHRPMAPNTSNQLNNTPKNTDELLTLFDINKDGKLSKEEVKGPLLNNFSSIDINSDGFLSKEELNKLPKPKDE